MTSTGAVIAETTLGYGSFQTMPVTSGATSPWQLVTEIWGDGVSNPTLTVPAADQDALLYKLVFSVQHNGLGSTTQHRCITTTDAGTGGNVVWTYYNATSTRLMGENMFLGPATGCTSFSAGVPMLHHCLLWSGVSTGPAGYYNLALYMNMPAGSTKLQSILFQTNYPSSRFLTADSYIRLYKLVI